MRQLRHDPLTLANGPLTLANGLAAVAAGAAALLSLDNAAAGLAAALAAASAGAALLWPRPKPMAVPVPDLEQIAVGEPEAPPREETDGLRREIRQMATMLERELVQAMGDVVSRTERMSTCAGELRSMAADIRTSSAATADAVQLAAAGVGTTAAAADELSHSLEAVRADVRRTGEMCRQAVARAHVADRTVQSLADATSHIGQVVGLIGTIARQTNMLALNATIEAARAGETGKGFAVVATEVKTLATSTARSTEDISGQVDAIRGAIGDAVDAIEGIVKVIDSLDSLSAAMESSMSQHLTLIESISARTGEAAASMHAAEANLSQALSVNDRVTEAAAEVDTEVGEVADRVRGFQKVTALVVKRGLRVAGEQPRPAQPMGVDFIVGNRRIQPLSSHLAADGARLTVAEPIASGTPVEIEVPKVGRLAAVVQRCEGQAVDLVYRMDEATRGKFAEWLATRGGAAEAA